MAKQLNVSEIKLNMAQPRMLTVQLVDELRRFSVLPKTAAA